MCSCQRVFGKKNFSSGSTREEISLGTTWLKKECMEKIT